ARRPTRNGIGGTTDATGTARRPPIIPNGLSGGGRHQRFRAPPCGGRTHLVGHASQPRVDATTPVPGMPRERPRRTTGRRTRTRGLDGTPRVQRVDRVLQPTVRGGEPPLAVRSEEHTSELQSREKLVCR